MKRLLPFIISLLVLIALLVNHSSQSNLPQPSPSSSPTIATASQSAVLSATSSATASPSATSLDDLEAELDSLFIEAEDFTNL